jgi:hypothetical protein
MRRFSVLIPALLSATFCAAHAPAQQFGFGVVGGVWTTADVSGTLHPESKRYILGPEAELRLPLGLSVEADALYRRIGYTGYSSTVVGSSITQVRANSWEFPVMAKLRLPSVIAHPFVGIGYAPRTIHGSAVSSGSYLSGITQNPPASVYTYYSNQHSNVSFPTTHGLIVSGGVEAGLGPIHISPQIRYVHWNAPFLNAQGGDGSFQFSSSQDEVLLMLGVTWR